MTPSVPRFALALALLAAPAAALATSPVAPPSPASVVLAFAGAWERADLDGVMSGFAEDATAFLPTPRSAARLAGRDAIRERFAVALAELRAAAEGPPYARILPRDLALQEYGDVAVVTFHAGRAPGEGVDPSAPLARRTFVLRRVDGAWRIVHLHASNLAAK